MGKCLHAGAPVRIRLLADSHGDVHAGRSDAHSGTSAAVVIGELCGDGGACRARDRVRLPVLAVLAVLARQAGSTGADHTPLSHARLVAKLAFGD